MPTTRVAGLVAPLNLLLDLGIRDGYLLPAAELFLLRDSK
jgi:hypothetical protein